ncbi:hypothetical protein [Azospirillum griseum]|uniref:Uncharacterized protein n=1 Tax=Azospirillum griseum TaxID=2496639 RepID=A0A3S0HYL6_9PROT|nr:hypothetical protein [Azospirillum griseum]RTR17218.1 hypothetical protein EJ903_18550 [Azospirillum griseum]
MKYKVSKFKNQTEALKYISIFIQNGNHLRTGKPLNDFGGMRSREILGNWLICSAVNFIFGQDRLTFSSDPTGGDGVIYDTITGETWPTEHVMACSSPNSEVENAETLILKQIYLKLNKGGAAYASGKTLVVFLDIGIGSWSPDRVARRLPDPLHFDNVWVVGLQEFDENQYVYAVTRLDLRLGRVPVWSVRLGKDFCTWEVDAMQ